MLLSSISEYTFLLVLELRGKILDEERRARGEERAGLTNIFSLGREREEKREPCVLLCAVGEGELGLGLGQGGDEVEEPRHEGGRVLLLGFGF